MCIYSMAHHWPKFQQKNSSNSCGVHVLQPCCRRKSNAREKEEVIEEREELGLPDAMAELELERTRSIGEGDQVVEEIVEDVIEEFEEVVG